jgi:hypothetical protein
MYDLTSSTSGRQHQRSPHQASHRLIPQAANHPPQRRNPQLAGEDGAAAAWLLAQHADGDPVRQRAFLDALRGAAGQGEASPAHLAYLEDRVRVNAGQRQLYGTQFTVTGGQFGPHPVDDPQRLDERRAEAGLEPFADYETRMQADHNERLYRSRERLISRIWSYSHAALREFPPGKDHMIAVRRILQWVNFVVCPYDGTNLKAAGRPSSLAVPLPMLCPTCGRRFELAGGNVIEQPPDETGGGSET